MNMNIFYRRIVDYTEVIKQRVGQAVSSDVSNPDRELIAGVVEKLNAELTICCSDLLVNLQRLEETEKANQKKTTRTTRKKNK